MSPTPEQRRKWRETNVERRRLYQYHFKCGTLDEYYAVYPRSRNYSPKPSDPERERHRWYDYHRRHGTLDQYYVLYPRGTRLKPRQTIEEKRAKKREIYQRNIAKERIRILNYYHRRQGLLIGSFTVTQWQALCEYYTPEGRCLCCGEIADLQMDHVVPVIKGGLNYIDNIQPLCGPCNNRKYTQTIDYRPDGGTFAATLRR